MIDSGKYRHYLTIEKRNATTNVWATYGYAWAQIDVTGGELANESEQTKAQRTYTVRTRYNPSLTIGTVGYRFNWSVQGATRYLYIHFTDSDSATFSEEDTFQCSEKVR